MISMTNVTKTFDGFKALDNIDMHVPVSTVYGLVGSNGAGKTTLIRHLSGVYRQDSGEVCINGQNVYENNAVKQKTGVIPDEVYFYPQSSTRDMAKFLSGIYTRFNWDYYKELSAAFPIDEKQSIRRMSKGMQKQSAFWLTIACRFDILLLDEPVDGLDPVMRRTVWKLLLKDVAEHGTTVVVSSHNLRELEDVCDHVGIMHSGKVVIERSLSDLQCGVYKFNAAFDNDLPKNISGISELHRSRTGKLYTIIVRGDKDEVSARLAEFSPSFMDIIPLTLEEIFIYEMGGEDYGGIL
ncbi:MAG: ABC transporter ATP-binding protein [Oscillospiraceae bacterium]|nr:ABC transporter ATP-binding protein [Oscillospiraceae bacterium]